MIQPQVPDVGGAGRPGRDDGVADSGVPGFRDFFRELTGHEPYVWQTVAADDVLQGRPPASVCVPTGFGKTSLMLAWFWALVADLARCAADESAVRGVPLRYVVVVDRRVVVDDTAAMAQRLAEMLRCAGDLGPALAACAKIIDGFVGESGVPRLECRLLRGGMPQRPENVRNPAVPAVIVGTVDLIGSRLLGRGYGVSRGRRPIEAALMGLDTLFVLDESHLCAQFVKTLEVLDSQAGAEDRLGGAVPGRATVVMTATPLDGGAVMDWDVEIAAQAGVAERRRRRRATAVTVEAVGSSTGDAAMKQVLRTISVEPGESTIVFFNTPGSATAAAKQLAGTKDTAGNPIEVVSLIGGMPSLFREQVTSSLDRIRTGASRATVDEPGLVVCATQTLEVGADLDADHLVTPAASVEALTQRVGRVNRVGARDGGSVRIIVGGSDKEPVYGPAAAHLGQALQEHSPATLGELLDQLAHPEPEWRMPASENAVLPRHVAAAYVRTAGSPYEPPVARWLRPPADPRAEVQVAFRDSLRQICDDAALIDHLDRWPPRPDEVWTVPIAAATTLVRTCIKNGTRIALMDPSRTEPTILGLEPEAVRPGWILVVEPQLDAFDIAGAGSDLLASGGDCAPFRVLDDEQLDAEQVVPPEAVWTPLFDRAGEPLGWTEVSPAREEQEDVPTLAYGLRDHGRDVERRAESWLRALGAPDGLVADVMLAARFHDEGKREDVIQEELSYQLGEDGTLARIGVDGDALAKSTLPRRLWPRARRLAGVPDGYRHEAASAEAVDGMISAGSITPRDPQLLRHLVLTHHGMFRSVGPAITDATVRISAYQDATRAEWTRRPDEFAELVDRYGPYTLSLAESIVRLADWHESGELA